MEKLIDELRKLGVVTQKELRKAPLPKDALRRIVSRLREKEPPSRETLDKVALLLGFQDWASLRQVMHGESDGDENFE